MRNSCSVLCLAILIVGFVGLADPVYAHANLVSSDPPPNSVLESSPKQIVLSFSEAIEPRFTQAFVYDSNGTRVDAGNLYDANHPTGLIISLPDLTSGVYTLTWKAVSAIDGHSTSGSFSFGVGNVVIQPEQNHESPQFAFPTPIEVVDRWLNYLAEAAFLGAVTFILLVWMPTRLEERPCIDPKVELKILSRTSLILTAAVATALFATILSLIIQVATVSKELSLANFIPIALSIVSSTRFGFVWELRFGTLLISIVLTRFLSNSISRKTWTVALIPALTLILTTSVSSHNAAATSYIPPLNLVADILHLTAASVWVGGLVAFVAALTALTKVGRREMLELIRRFSSIAVISVGAIGITGLYSLLIEVGSLAGLFSTAYGILLLAKISLFIPMIAFGALNQFRLYNKFTDDRSAAAASSSLRQFRISTISETALGMIILILVGVITASAPVAPTAGSPFQVNPQAAIFQGSSIEGINATLRVFPLQVGTNHFEIDFSDSKGNPAPDITNTEITFRNLDRDLGQSTASTTKASTARFTFDGTYLSLPGRWIVEALAHRSHGYDVLIRFQVQVPSISMRFSVKTLPANSAPYGVAIDNLGRVWLAESGTGQIASYDTITRTLTQYSLPREGSKPFYLTTDQNDSIWITETQYNRILRFNPPSGTFDEYPIPTEGAVPGGIVLDSRGLVWFTEEVAGQVGVLDPGTGKIAEIIIPTPDSIPIQLAVDQKGCVWFTEAKAGKIGMVNPTNRTIREFAPTNSTLLGPTGVAIGPDGNIWITQHGGNKLTAFNPVNGTFNDYPTQDSQAYPFGVAISGKRIWFVEHIGNAIASFNLETKSFDSFPIPSTSSDVQLLTVDQNGNVWFTLPAANSFGVLSPIASSLQIESTSPPDQLPLLVLPAAILISSATCIVFIAGQRRMKKRASS